MSKQIDVPDGGIKRILNHEVVLVAKCMQDFKPGEVVTVTNSHSSDAVAKVKVIAVDTHEMQVQLI